MATREVYFHDILKAFTDADLSDVFMAWIDKYHPTAPDAYKALYRLGEERGFKVLMEQIKSGEFKDELQKL